jgi:hypothetical protein
MLDLLSYIDHYFGSAPGLNISWTGRIGQTDPARRGDEIQLVPPLSTTSSTLFDAVTLRDSR